MRPVISQILRPKVNLPILDQLRLRTRFCFSFDRLTKITGAIIRVSRDSDLAEMDIGSIGHDLDLATLQSFIGSSGASVSVAYDRSGNNNHAAMDIKSSQLRIAENGIINIANGKPFLRSLYRNTHVTSYLTIPVSTFSGMTSGALLGVFRQGLGGEGVGGIARISNSRSANHLGWLDGKGYTGFLASARYAFPDYLSTRDLALHITVNTGNPGQITLYKNGVIKPCETIPTNDFDNNPTTAFFPDSQYGDIDISELVILESSPTDSQRQLLESHRRKYFQI